MVGIVMENIVQSKREKRCEQLSLNFLPFLEQVLSLALNFSQMISGQNVNRNGRLAHEIGIGVVFDHEGAMVDDGALAKSLNSEVLILPSLVVQTGDLHDTRLNEEQFVCFVTILAEELTSLECATLHAENQLLLRRS